MAQFPTGRISPPADTAIRKISAALGAATRAMAEWRTQVAASSLNAYTAREAYQSLMSAREIVNGLIATPGLAAQYQTLFGKAGGYNPQTEWTTAAAAIETFRVWFASNWPYRTADNKPAWEQGRANGELEAIVVSISNGTRTATLAQIDAVLAAIE